MDIASTLDHTVLSVDCTPDDIDRIIEEARSSGFAAICIPPYYTKYAREQMEDEAAFGLATVISFPMGYDSTSSKVESLKKCANDGADEVDVVANICAIKSGEWRYLDHDLQSVVAAAHSRSLRIKIIIEAGLLNENELKRVCAMCSEIKPDFVKTSTGKNGGGATVDMVRAIRALLPEEIAVKASGGIRTREQAEQLLNAGASRLGTSSGTAIIGS